MAPSYRLQPRWCTVLTEAHATPWSINSEESGVIDEREKSQMLPLYAERPPLKVDEGGAARIANSRISLDLVVDQYENGMTPEDMVRAYDTLSLADVHAVIAYYLRHRDAVRAYLKRRDEDAEAVRAKIEAERPRISRQELLARRSVVESAEAPTGK
jgi:uncharacterized protein (DUF433 family)